MLLVLIQVKEPFENCDQNTQPADHVIYAGPSMVRAGPDVSGEEWNEGGSHDFRYFDKFEGFSRFAAFLAVPGLLLLEPGKNRVVRRKWICSGHKS